MMSWWSFRDKKFGNKMVYVSTIEPVKEQPEFKWDTRVPTVGAPSKIWGERFALRVDMTKPMFFDKDFPIVLINNTEQKLVAIVPELDLLFCASGLTSDCALLPVKEFRKMTWKQIEDALGFSIYPIHD